MRCRACSEEAPDGKRFCPNCGAPLSESCTTCGAALTPGQKFCADCGTPTGAVAAASPPRVIAESPVAERRLCSVLFVDLVGFTPFAESRDPEAVREVLTRYFDRAQAIIENYGGTLEKFIGDAVMAVWGAPIANEDDAERAVRAGLDVVASVSALGREIGDENLRARGGIVTGEAAVTIGRVSEGMVLGDTVNSASRVQSAAEPGTVLVDESTWRAASDAIVFEAVGELTLKGKAETVSAWRAVRVVGKRKGLGRSERLEPPFVGRDEELRLVKDLLHATAREQRSRLVSVTGVPGIGKSRLAWEFLKYVDGLADTVFWHQGRSASYGEGVTFGALGEMVRMRAGINDTDAPDESRAKLRACVGEYVAEESDRAWIETRLTHLLGLTDAPPGDRDELFSAWRTFFEAIATQGVTVLIFEDLQWADAGLIDFIESIPEWSRHHPIMVVTLSRPELLDRRPDWGAGQRSFTSLHLEPLGDEEMRELLAGFVHGLPAQATSSVLARAEGVPLYAVETVRMLVDRGLLLEVDGVYRVEGEIGTLDIPETLHALVASRLDSLPTTQRVLLQDAAVVGTSFLPETLAALSGLDRAEIDAQLRDLVRKEFLALDSDPRSPERGQYSFVQSVIGEVALGMLARRDLSSKHLAAARYYEGLGDEELTAIVASHYGAAQRAAPEGADADALRAVAGEWLHKAGDRARSLGSPEQALDLYRQALAVTDGAQRAALAQAASEAALDVVAYDAALAYAEEAVDLYHGLGRVSDEGRARYQVAVTLGALGRLEEQARYARAAYEELGEGADGSVRGLLAVAVAAAHNHRSEWAQALEWAEVTLTMAERDDDADLFSQGLEARGFALFIAGRHQEASLLSRGRLAIAIEGGKLRDQARTMLSLSLSMLPDNPHETVRIGLEAAEVSRRAGLRRAEETNRLNAAESCLMLGQLERFRDVMGELENRGVQPINRPWAEFLKAEARVLTGDFATVDATLDELTFHLGNEEVVAHRTTELGARAVMLYTAGEFERARDDAAEAVGLDPTGINAGATISLWARSAIALRDVEGTRAALAAARRVRGRWVGALRLETEGALAAFEGRSDEAVRRFSDAIDAWRDLDCSFDVAMTETEILQSLGVEHPLAVTAKEAEDIFEELAMRPYLERLRALRTASA